MKLLTSKNPAARSALFMAAGGVLLSPLDKLLKSKEQKVYDTIDSQSPQLILVCGPPRSGTSLVTQYLINSMQVSYINNLTSLFPHSPVVANHWMKPLVKPRTGSYKAFYGRSRGLAGLNDGLHIWDRWLGDQRDQIPESLLPDAETNMHQFFSAWLNEFGSPCVNKVNRLISCLDLVAPVLPDTRFIYLQRDPVMLAQSLLIARSDISGDPQRNYGLTHPDRCLDDPVEDVCRQVEFYSELQKKYESGPNAERIHFVNYEDFCQQPHLFMMDLKASLPYDVEIKGEPDPELSFKVSNSARLPDDQMQHIRQRLEGINKPLPTKPATTQYA